MISKCPARLTGLGQNYVSSMQNMQIAQKANLFFCSQVKLLFRCLRSHVIDYKLNDCRTLGTNGSSDCHRHTSGLLWFHTFTVFLHLNLYSNKTNSINKKDQLFSQKRKMQWLQYKDRENQQLNSYISLTN